MTHKCRCKPSEYPFYCEYHQCYKTDHWHKLCLHNEKYREAWEEGRGPGQPIAPKYALLPAKSKKKGVGDYLKDVTLEIKIKMKKGCNCPALLSEMNNLGINGCKRERDRLVNALKENAKNYTWTETLVAATKIVTTKLVWKIDIADPYGSLLDEAIRRAENEESKILKERKPNDLQ